MTTTEVPLPLAAEATNATGPCSAGLRRTLPAVLRSERIKATTVRANKVLLATSAIIGLLTSWATATFVTDEVLTATDVFVYPMLLTAVLAAIAGILLFTSEVQHGTLAGTSPPTRRGGPSLPPRPSSLPASACSWVVGMATGFVGALAGGIEVGNTSGVMTTVLWGCSTPSARRCSVSASGWWSATARVPSPACSSGGWSSRPSSSNSPRPRSFGSCPSTPGSARWASSRTSTYPRSSLRAVEPAPRLDLLGLRHRRPGPRGGAAGATRRRLRRRSLRPDATPGAGSKGAGSALLLGSSDLSTHPSLTGAPKVPVGTQQLARMREA